ncbi:hypothetical protein PMAYCL1PPCAC_03769 [Pristionchus mayeri]|uniref:Uncharacterized protein n=1 Tax=Pristionchus mayeri TaxID=1317129 RepID=A0AAN5C985_9BILA|nr:hypothetical protein PMAYCL1PPCAC_03769 [Pristionchus mayeri]
MGIIVAIPLVTVWTQIPWLAQDRDGVLIYVFHHTNLLFLPPFLVLICAGFGVKKRIACLIYPMIIMMILLAVGSIALQFYMFEYYDSLALKIACVLLEVMILLYIVYVIRLLSRVIYEIRKEKSTQ